MAISSEPKSTHVSDPVLRPFLQADFDAADYLNTTLPALSHTSSTSARGNLGRSAPLSDLSSQLQTLLSQLNAQTSRLSTVLTQLTDEIVRSGSRLAYEVELLRGETMSMSDAVENGLKEHIEVLAPSKVKQIEHVNAADTTGAVGIGGTIEVDSAEAQEDSSMEPEFLSQLRTLTTVRARLDSVVKTFGSAMQWPVAPSDLATVSSSIISVSAPAADEAERERKAKAYNEELHGEINAMLAAGHDGLMTATTRVAELRALLDVWKGTTEEKARVKLVDSLQKLVDDKARSAGTGRNLSANPQPRIMDYRYGGFDSSAVTSKLPDLTRTAKVGGYGFLQNLRDLKNEMYADS